MGARPSDQTREPQPSRLGAARWSLRSGALRERSAASVDDSVEARQDPWGVARPGERKPIGGSQRQGLFSDRAGLGSSPTTEKSSDSSWSPFRW